MFFSRGGWLRLRLAVTTRPSKRRLEPAEANMDAYRDHCSKAKHVARTSSFPARGHASLVRRWHNPVVVWLEHARVARTTPGSLLPFPDSLHDYPDVGRELEVDCCGSEDRQPWAFLHLVTTPRRDTTWAISPRLGLPESSSFSPIPCGLHCPCWSLVIHGAAAASPEALTTTVLAVKQAHTTAFSNHTWNQSLAAFSAFWPAFAMESAS
jgi:hypothetical protein